MNRNTTALEGVALVGNQLELVTPTTVAGTLYGIAFALFCLYVHALVSRLQDEGRKRQTRFMLVYSAVIMLCGLYDLVSNAWVIQDAYIKHVTYPGPYDYIYTTFHTPTIAVGLTCQIAVDSLTSAIQIWRVWVVWSATRYANFVIVFPSLCFLIFTALNFRTVILETIGPFAKPAKLDPKTEIAAITIQGATTMICTMLILLFLLVRQWRLRKLIGKAHGSAGYMKIVAILIESYALESAWLLIEAVVLQPPAGIFFAEGKTYIEILAYLLVQYRVASGTAYESQRGQSLMSSLNWNHSDHATTQFESRRETSGDRHASTKPGGPDVLLVTNIA